MSYGSRLFASGKRCSTLLDTAIAVAAWAGTLALLAHGGTRLAPGGKLGLDPLSGLLAAGASLPLLAWRRSPFGVFAATTVASAALLLLGYPAAPPLGPTAALYLLASSRDESHPWTNRTTAAVAALFLAHIAAFGVGRGELPAEELAIGALVWAVAWFAGERTRLRRAQIIELEQRALRAERDAERDRRLIAAEERGRIARDLHDSAGHAINVIGIQAGAARLLLERDPERSRAALETVELVARQTAGEIDQIVLALRNGDGPSENGVTPSGLAALDTLVAQHAAAGLAVNVTRHGAPRDLGAPLDTAAYRILQEALTNARRHGAGGAEVGLRFCAEALELVVANPTVGPVSARENGGHGLIGMRERAALLGGALETASAEGTFRVTARLPYDATARLPDDAQ
ncbi:MAG TPA: histidine kinase [Solirubrobacteraceae bacterium]